ncbi:MAG: HNH endonuclease [Paeniclostridium sp.]
MLKKFCRCGKKIPQNIKMCSECEAKLTKSKRKGYKDYKSKRTDIKEQKFYSLSNKAWVITKEVVKARDNGVCLLCESKNDKGYVDDVHHIIELKEDWSRRFDMSNLICLCKRCHFYVHKKYRKDNKSKKEMQDKLRKLLEGRG